MPEHQFHILLVEDDASVRESVAAVLRDEGYDVTTANDGQEAMRALQAGTDLVVADLVMPHVDGRSLLRWIMQNHPATSVILMTGFGTISQAVDAIKAGATAYLTKPLDPGELLHQVKKTLEDKTAAAGVVAASRAAPRRVALPPHHRARAGHAEGLRRHRSRRAGQNDRAGLR